MRKLLAALPLLIVFVLMAHLSYAPPLPPAATEGAPLNEFAVALIVLGVGYAAYYMYKKKSKTEAA